MKSKSKIIIIDNIVNQNLILPVKTLYFLSFSLTYSDISIFKTMMLLSTVLLEIPSGYLADRFGNKKIGVLGLLFTTVSLFMMAFLHDPIAFYMANVLLGFGSAFESGSTTTYKIELGKKYSFSYADLFVKITKYGSLINFLLLIFSPMLYAQYRNLPFLFTAILYLIGLFVFISLPNIEEDRENLELKKNSFLAVTKDIFVKILANKKFLLEIFITSVTVGFLISNFDFYPVFFEKININVNLFGVIYSSFMLITFLSTRLFQKEYFLNRTYLLLFGASLSFFGIQQANFYLVILSVILQQFVFSFLNIRFSKLLIVEAEKQTDSSTYQSLISFIVTIIRLFLALGVSIILKLFSLSLSFKIIGVTLLLLMMIYKILVSRMIKVEKITLLEI
ncbi:MFS transporter [Lactococcus petauri]|uniref:MFS transporter n=2 Tax=Lactococcus petauri TaxID=1940789 RepID=UPI0013FE00B8|nr:MFS transporter [Lactococcus petauri]NHI75505.1 MFS transporter [Lactococcus petauri]USI65731.1 MFS transporter [Lactococcus petauri]